MPRKLCKDIAAMLSNFWWNHQNRERCIRWKRWEQMGYANEIGGLGFRNLEAFNTALLAKCMWHILINPDSLAAQIIKQKYFREGQLLDAKIGSRLSFIWRSLHSSVGLLKEGLVWRLGNGESIKIWGQKWLPIPSSFSVQSLVNTLGQQAKVKQLIDPLSGDWNCNLINHIFSPMEATIICSLPLSRNNAADQLIWRPSPNDQLIVKTAYHMEKAKLKRIEGESSNGAANDKFQKTLWKLNVPGFIIHFLWKAC